MWLLYSFLCAFADSLAALYNKKLMNKKQDPIIVSFIIHGIGSLILFSFLIVSKQSLIIPTNSVLLVMATALIAGLAGIIILKAFKKADLSLISPIQTSTPLIILILAIFFLGETPKPIGLLGILLVVLGGLVLDKKPRESFIQIARRIVSFKPALLGLLAATLYAIASVLDKVGLRNTEPSLWVFYVYLFIFLFLLPIALQKKRLSFKNIAKQKNNILLVTIFSVGAIYLQMMALDTGNVVYVMSIKRLSTVFAVIIAFFLLKENRALKRLRGAFIMVVGAILIGLS